MDTLSHRVQTTLSLLLLALCSASWSSVCSAQEAAVDTAAEQFFESKVRPVLVDRCLSCHGSEKQEGGVRFDSAAALNRGGDSGPIVNRENLAQSRLLEVVEYQDDIKMPPTAKLAEAELVVLREWVARGALFPAKAEAGLYAPSSPGGIARFRESHWSFRPIRRPAIPASSFPEWELSAIDRLITSPLKKAGLTPSPLADRATLLRRASIDLLGVPPSAEQVAEFANDTNPYAWESVVDRLLASPEYGVRWGRHWLDVARYADTKGYVFTEERKYPFSYTYRDYVINALNDDRPYDRFLIEQIAADQLDLNGDRSVLAALGFLTLGRRFGNNQNDIIDDRIDVVTRGLMGLAVQCARCHDHKFDPIPTADYYSLYGVFASSVEPGDLPQIGDPVDGAAYREYIAELENREKAVEAFVAPKLQEALNLVRSQSAEYLISTVTNDRSKFPEGFRLSLGPRDIRPEVITRWKNFIAGTKTEHHPIFAPWHVLAALPEENFAMGAADYLATLQAEPSATSPKINEHVRKALAGLKPMSMVDVAATYGKLFGDIHQQYQRLQQPTHTAGENTPAATTDTTTDPKHADTKTTPAETPTAPPAPLDADGEQIRQLLYSETGPLNVPKEELRRFFDRATRNRLTELRKQVDAWKANSVAAPPRAMVLNDAPQPVAARILIRGNPGRLGDEVPRRFLQVLSRPEDRFSKGSGRLEMAQAIAHAENPLTARMIANRVWMHHFGKGLAGTPGDFGIRGLPPSNPDLLDFLASMLIEEGWSLKKLHRAILLSAVYQQQSFDRPDELAADPENNMFWKMNRRRLDFESMRDSLLTVTGRINRELGGRPVDLFSSPFTTRRTVYGFVDRQDLPGTFRVFDFASPDVSVPQRPQTTVPQQALYGMNSAFVLEQSGHVTKAVLAQLPNSGDSVTANDTTELDQAIVSVYRQILLRSPETDELTAARSFVLAAGTPDTTERPFNLRTAIGQLAQALLLSNEFVFVD